MDEPASAVHFQPRQNRIDSIAEIIRSPKHGETIPCPLFLAVRNFRPPMIVKRVAVAGGRGDGPGVSLVAAWLSQVTDQPG